MIFTPLPLHGAFRVGLEPVVDERGHFARSFCAEEFQRHGLNPSVVQCNLSFNARRGTLRGLHYQAPPHGECKLIRCTRGAIFDVLVDLRRDSPSFCQWAAVELTPDSHEMVYAPDGVAHGFITLADSSEVHYQMSHPYIAESACGVRWDDPAFGIEWPVPVASISSRDAAHPPFVP